MCVWKWKKALFYFKNFIASVTWSRVIFMSSLCWWLRSFRACRSSSTEALSISRISRISRGLLGTGGGGDFGTGGMRETLETWSREGGAEMDCWLLGYNVSTQSTSDKRKIEERNTNAPHICMSPTWQISRILTQLRRWRTQLLLRATKWWNPSDHLLDGGKFQGHGKLYAWGTIEEGKKFYGSGSKVTAIAGNFIIR